MKILKQEMPKEIIDSFNASQELTMEILGQYDKHCEQEFSGICIRDQKDFDWVDYHFNMLFLGVTVTRLYKRHLFQKVVDCLVLIAKQKTTPSSD